MWLSWARTVYYVILLLCHKKQRKLLIIFQAPIPCDGSGRFCELNGTTSLVPATKFLDTIGVKIMTIPTLFFTSISNLFFVYPCLYYPDGMRRKKADERERERERESENAIENVKYIILIVIIMIT